MLVRHFQSLESLPMIGKMVLGILLCCCVDVYANIPQPSCVLYGQVKSEYGWPMTEGELLVTLDDGLGLPYTGMLR